MRARGRVRGPGLLVSEVLQALNDEGLLFAGVAGALERRLRDRADVSACVRAAGNEDRVDRRCVERCLEAVEGE